jgi:hypothetical protein
MLLVTLHKGWLKATHCVGEDWGLKDIPHHHTPAVLECGVVLIGLAVTFILPIP